MIGTKNFYPLKCYSSDQFEPQRLEIGPLIRKYLKTESQGSKSVKAKRKTAALCFSPVSLRKLYTISSLGDRALRSGYLAPIEVFKRKTFWMSLGSKVWYVR